MSGDKGLTNISSSSSSSVCIFCLQNDSKSIQNGSAGRHEGVIGVAQHKFFKLVEKYLEDRAGILSLDPLTLEVKVASCLECCNLMENYCDAYHEMRCLELEVDWKLERIRRIMKEADGNPRRVSGFRDVCLLEGRDMEKSMEFRTNFQKQCELNGARKFPRICLQRIATSGTNGNGYQDTTGFIPIPQSELTIVSTTSIRPLDGGGTSSCHSDQISNWSPAPSPLSDPPMDPPSDGEPDFCSSPPPTPPVRDEMEEPSAKKLKLSSPDVRIAVNELERVKVDLDLTIMKESPSKQLQCSSPNDFQPEAKRKVRTVFQCATCKATFPNANRLDTHVFIVHPPTEDADEVADDEICYGEGDIDDDAADADWVDVEGNICDDNEDALPSDSSDDNGEDEDVGKEKISAPEGPHEAAESISKRVKRQAKKPGDEKRLSCHKCPEPRPTFKSFLRQQLHHKYLHSNGCATLTTMDNVQVLRLKEHHLKLDEIPTTCLKSCSEYFPDCPRKFMLESELTAHKEYHGDVKCGSCDVVMDNAVDMAHHEIEHFSSSVSCGKCSEFSTPFEGELINHCFQVHMNKPPLHATCPICQQEFKYVDRVPVIHYLNYHDLSRLDDPESTGVRCELNDCSAYFLTEDQLQQHWSSVHAEGSGIAETASPVKKMKPSRLIAAIKNKSKEYSEACEHCPSKFRTGWELKAHVKFCHADKIKGEPCGQIQLTEQGLTIDEFVIDKQCRCKICGNVFGSREQLTRHKAHHGEFKCNFCDVVKSVATELAVHETVHNIGGNGGRKKGFKCPRCPFTTAKRPIYLDHHLESHLGLASDKKRCPICWKPVPMSGRSSQSGAQKAWMVSHYMDNHDKTGLDPDKMPKCALCPGIFRTPVQLHNHCRDTHGKSNFECSDCGKVFKKKDKLQRHRRRVHKVDETSFQFLCSFPDCGRRLETQKDLDYHEYSAHKEKDVGILVCAECGKQCLGKGQLHAHLKVHEDKKRIQEHAVAEMESTKPFVCDQCGKSFKQKQWLQQHCKRHKGPESWEFVCSVCSKRCFDKGKLEEHMRTHSQEKPFACQECGSAYAHAHNLKNHMKSKHQDIKPT